MILIRGINGETFARDIEKGNIGFRDLLSSLLNTNYTGYSYSDYYEKYFVKAFNNYMSKPENFNQFEKEDAEKLLLMLNNTIPYIYLTYFHILNKNSIQDWLVNFEDDMHFIFIEPKIDEISNNMIGKNLFGTKMDYTTNINETNINEFITKSAGLLPLIQHEMKKVKSIEVAKIYSESMFNLMLPLFNRVIDKKYGSFENEFRIIYKTPTVINPINYEFKPEENRIFNISINECRNYYGSMEVIKKANDFKRCDLPLTAKNVLINPQKTSLIEEVLNGNSFRLHSEFKNVNIENAVINSGYIGNKEDCRRFIIEKFTH